MTVTQSFRDLPAVEPVDPPRRLAQTFLARFDSCPRSAYLGVKHEVPSHPMARGTLLHMFYERMLLELLGTGQQVLSVHDGEELAAKTGRMVGELYSAHPELVVPRADLDATRAMAFNLAKGSDVDPSKVVAVERKFVVRCGDWDVSGRLDVATVDGDTAEISDVKSQLSIPSQEEFERQFQLRLYGVLLLFGEPVEEAECPTCLGHGLIAGTENDPGYVGPCPDCPAATVAENEQPRGTGTVERRLPSLGEGVQWVRGRELYARYLDSEGRGRFREAWMSRRDLEDFRADVARLTGRVSQAFESWKFPAVPGSWCSRCPAVSECPLPVALRRYAGSVSTPEEAAEAMAWAVRTKDDVQATEKEVKAWCSEHGPLIVGDLEFDFVAEERWSTDWSALEERAGQSEPFAVSEVRRRAVSSRFRGRRVNEEAA